MPIANIPGFIRNINNFRKDDMKTDVQTPNHWACSTTKKNNDGLRSGIIKSEAQNATM